MYKFEWKNWAVYCPLPLFFFFPLKLKKFNLVDKGRSIMKEMNKTTTEKISSFPSFKSCQSSSMPKTPVVDAPTDTTSFKLMLLCYLFKLDETFS